MRGELWGDRAHRLWEIGWERLGEVAEWTLEHEPLIEGLQALVDIRVMERVTRRAHPNREAALARVVQLLGLEL